MACRSERYSGATRNGIPWANWAELAGGPVNTFYEPGSLADIVGIVQDADRRHIRVVGSGWVFDDIADRPEAAGAGPAPGLLLHVKITPTPKAGKQLTYTVAVTDSSHTPVEQAAVKLHNYLASNADDIHVGSTDQNGVVSFTNLTLRKKTTTRRVEGELITTVTSPKLTVSKDGFDSVDITLV